MARPKQVCSWEAAGRSIRTPFQDILDIDPDEFAVLAEFTPQQRAFPPSARQYRYRQTSTRKRHREACSSNIRREVSRKRACPSSYSLHWRMRAISSPRRPLPAGAQNRSRLRRRRNLLATSPKPLLEQLKDQTDPKLLGLLRTPLSDILTAMNDSDRYRAGLALEALAFKIMRLLDMTYVATRLRANQTAAQRWTSSSRVPASSFPAGRSSARTPRASPLTMLQRKSGLTHFLKSNAIVMVTTGQIGAEARRYANRIMTDSNLAIVMLQRGDLHAISERPATILRAFEREARHAMHLKSSISSGERQCRTNNPRPCTTKPRSDAFSTPIAWT